MSNELQHKMYHYEETPPPGVWARIAEELDDIHIGDQFPSKLYNSNIQPPPSAWSAIQNKLDELQLSVEFPATLYNLEATPPATAWNKIEAELDQQHAPVVPIRKRTIPWVRYAAAAAVLAILSFGTVRILSSSNENAGESMVTTTPDKTSLPNANNQESNTTTEITTTDSAPAIAEEEARSEAALQESKNMYASLSSSDRQRIKQISEELLESPANPIMVTANFNPAHTYEELECNDVVTPVFATNSEIDLANRYAMMMTPDGRMIRISKKLGELVCCVSGEEQDDACIDQLKKWRLKIANSPVTPSPGNFMDILDLVHVLKDSNL